MNYIGSKRKLLPFIQNAILENISGKRVFCDLFAGTGIVGETMKFHFDKVIANDFEYYSYVLLNNYIGINEPIDWKLPNEVEPYEGVIFKEYASNGRMYFTPENAKLIDGWYRVISQYKTPDYWHYIASLLESADKVANTASVYAAYLKQFKNTALKEFELKPAKQFSVYGEQHNEVYNLDANKLIREISGDVLYLDPPYNERQYGANYHILNTIAKGYADNPKGKTGITDYKKSSYCRRKEALDSLVDLLEKADFEYIFLSYNNEGIITPEEIKDVMVSLGDYSIFTQKYRTYKADNNRNNKSLNTTEYIHALRK